MRIIALSLWERVAEGRVRAAATTRRIPSLPFPTGCLHRIPSPNPLPEGEGVRGMRIIALSLWERVAEGRVRATQ